MNRGALTLPQDYVTRDILEVEMLKTNRLVCKSCRDNKEATHKCITCCNFLCSSCESMHKVFFQLMNISYLYLQILIFLNTDQYFLLDACNTRAVSLYGIHR